jgi:MoaA/NifB/PqqE/SkfB family radical SAM enzyme
MRDAGLTHLSLSVDAADPKIHKILRGGTSLPKVQTNLLEFRRVCPSVGVVFLTTVTSLNISSIEQLIISGAEAGVKTFVLRQVFYYPTSRVVSHSTMPSLLVTDQQFTEMQERILEKFGESLDFEFQTAESIIQMAEVIQAESLLI